MSDTMRVTFHTGRVRVNNTVRGHTYTVLKGDSLYKIARKVYGSGERWNDIYTANSATIPHPCMLREGMVLHI